LEDTLFLQSKFDLRPILEAYRLLPGAAIMRLPLAAALLTLTLLSLEAGTAQPLPVFLDHRYERNKICIDSLLAPAVTNGLKNAGVRLSGDEAREKIDRIIFCHPLFTSKNAVNCAKGGILEIPYIWHWVTPNLRHDIICLPASTALNKAKAPAGFEKYASYADIDRTPYLFLSNLVSDSALFSHLQCGSFLAFGWCIKREMAFSNLSSQCRYKIKIKQEGIHVWCEALVDVEEKSGTGRLVITVHNTLNIVHFKKLTASESEWRLDFGLGPHVNWYNKKALAPDEVKKVRRIPVNDKAAARINGMVEAWLNNSSGRVNK
jgi:hypothetical protein